MQFPAPTAPAVVAFVPLRAGSKGLPGKNVRDLGGKPLYMWTVEQALRTVGECVISTDINEILSSSPLPGCSVTPRPPQLATDAATMTQVISHYLQALPKGLETIVLLQATSPLRTDEDILTALEVFGHGEFDVVMTVASTESSILKSGTVIGSTFQPVSQPSYCFSNRQELPTVYKPNGAVYVISVSAFIRNGGFASNRLGAVIVPASRSIDIDSLADFAHMEDVAKATGLGTSGN